MSKAALKKQAAKEAKAQAKANDKAGMPNPKKEIPKKHLGQEGGCRNIDQWEKTLSTNQWLGGVSPSELDAQACSEMQGMVPNVETHPHLFAWWALAAKFPENVRATWKAPVPHAKVKKPAGKLLGAGCKTPAPQPKKEEKPAAAEDEFDPFADDDEDEEAKLAALELKHKAAVAKAGKKEKVVIAKSIVIFEVKPWGEDTNLDELAKMVLAIEMDGLSWKTEYKKAPIAYGVEKLVIGCVIEDVKVSTDDLQEKIEAFEDHV